LVYNHNTSQNTFTGVCLPEVCNEEDLQSALTPFADTTVYGYTRPRELDGLTIAGLTVIGIWVAVIVVVSFLNMVFKK
jgi:hypothetical protein